MNHMFQISDEEYAKLAAYAARYKQTPEKLFQEWVWRITRNTEAPSFSKQEKSPTQKKQKVREQQFLNSPLSQVAGMFAIDEPGWADKHDEYLAETYLENHADK